MIGTKALALTLIAAVSTVALPQDPPTLDQALALSYSANPQYRIASINELAGISDVRAGDRLYELAEDTDPFVKAEVLLYAMNNGYCKALIARNRYVNETYHHELTALDKDMPDAERREVTAKIRLRLRIDDRSFDNRPYHIKWLTSFSKKLQDGPLLDRIATLIFKQADLDWTWALFLGFGCGTGAPVPYDSTDDLLDLYRRRPRLCLRLIQDDDSLALRLYGSLAARNRSESVTGLIKLTSSLDSRTRAVAMLALTQVSTKSVKQLSERLLKDKTGYVRGAAASALLAVDTAGEFQRVKQLCIDDHEVAEQVLHAITAKNEYEEWRETGLKLALLSDLDESRTVELCTSVALKGDKSVAYNAILVLAQCSKDTAIEELRQLRRLVKDDGLIDTIGSHLKYLGFDPPRN